jgi:predicted AlkP superfamily pyrophosphatase or phosphodiesterase
LLEAQGAISGVEHVLIIGCDGMGSVAFAKPEIPVMRKLMEQGSYTLKARGVMPTSSSPNWASMIMGAGPELHGVTSNDWQTNKFDIAPVATGSGGIFPTIFGVLREQRPNANIVAVYDWSDFGRLIEPQATDQSLHVKDAIETAQKAVKIIKEKKPTFMFVHFDGVDHAGHAFGWGSGQYFKAVELADSLIGGVVEALEQAGIKDKTIVLITADHGGKGTGHGGATMDELLIPWILSGPGVARGKELKTQVNTYDTAATVAHIFGVKAPDVWIGKPVIEAFE